MRAPEQRTEFPPRVALHWCMARHRRMRRSRSSPSLGEVGAQLVDHQADPAGGDPRDALPGLCVGRAVVVGAEDGVDKNLAALMSVGSPVVSCASARA
jgi:hypothetical protein